MPIAKRFVTVAIAILFSINTVFAHGQVTQGDSASAISVTAVAAGDRVRFTAPASIVQMRLEVFDANGKKLFDNEIRGGNVIDWLLQSAQGEPLPDDSYLCLVTVKSLSGKITQRIGSAKIEKATASFQTALAAQMTAQQSQAVGPIDEDASLIVLPEDHQTGAVVAHNGEDGQIIRGKGALSFRIGDFFSGRDIEQMRLTPEGNLGIGITHPQVKLDVDGLIRASQGIVFPDGSIQLSAARKTLGAASVLPGSLRVQGQNIGTLSVETSGTGTTGKIPKWLDGPNGVLTDSNITEASGAIGINAAPSTSFRLDVNGSTRIRGANAGFNLEGSSAAGNIWLFQTVDSDGRFRLFGQDNVNPGVERLTINLATGNVGIGATSPGSKLEIGGNALIFPQSGPGSLHIRNRTSADFSQVVFDDSANIYKGYIGFIGSTAALDPARRNNVEFGTNNASITFRPSETEAMRIANNGKVGIGTANPLSRLEVVDSSNKGLRVQTNATGGTVASFGGLGQFQIDSNGIAGGRLAVLENGNVGIGAVNPSQKLSVSGSGVVRALVNSDANAGFSLALNDLPKWSMATTNGDFQLFNDATGQNAMMVNTTTNNVAIGTTPTGGKLAVFSGGSLGLQVAVGTAGGSVARFGQNGEFQVDDVDFVGGRFRVTEEALVLINHPPALPDPLNNATPKLVVNGTIRAVLNAEGFSPMCYNPIDQLLAQCVSSIRFKENVNNFGRGLDLVERLRPVSFNWKHGGMADMGLIAEEVAKEEPLLATYDDKGTVQGVKYDRVAIVLLNAVREQQSQIKTQTEMIQRQQGQLSTQGRLIKQQQSQLASLKRAVFKSHRKSRNVR